MQTLQAGYRGLSLLFDLNWDRIICVLSIIGALMFGAFIGTLIAPY